MRAFSAKKHAPTSLAPFVFDPRTRALVCNGLPGHVQFYSVDTDKQLFSVSVSVSTVWSGLELWRAGRILMFCHIFCIYYIKLQRVSMFLSVCSPLFSTRPSEGDTICHAYADRSVNGSNLNKLPLPHPHGGSQQGILACQRLRKV